MPIRSSPVAALSLFIVLIAAQSNTARADEWSLTTADLRTQAIVPQAFTAQGLHATDIDGNSDRTIPLEQFVSIQRGSNDQPPAATPNFTLLLANGDRLLGEPGPVTGQKLTWVSPTLGPVPLPFNQLMAINKGMNFTPPDEAPRQDVVTLANGDSVAGVFTDCADHKMTIQADNGAISVPLDSIKRIAFAPTGAPGAVDSTRAFRIRLSDGSALTVANAAFDGQQLKVTLKGKSPIHLSLPITNVQAIEQVNGPVSWLSSQMPVESVQIPYLSGAQTWPAKFDLAVDGSPLCVDNRIYDRGIGVHAYSKLTFNLDPQWAAFRTQYAIDTNRQQPRTFADVTVRIKLDDKLVHEEKHVREGGISREVVLDLKGARTLTLECDYGDAGDTQAHLDWLQPALLRARPPIQPATRSTTQPTTQPTTRP